MQVTQGRLGAGSRCCRGGRAAEQEGHKPGERLSACTGRGGRRTVAAMRAALLRVLRCLGRVERDVPLGDVALAAAGVADIVPPVVGLQYLHLAGRRGRAGAGVG